MASELEMELEELMIEFDKLKETDQAKFEVIKKLTENVHKAREEVEEWRASFDLYDKATRELHDLFPHPEPLTQRDLGQVCQMAADEIKKHRAT